MYACSISKDYTLGKFKFITFIPSLIAPDVPSAMLDNLTLSTPYLEKLWSFACPLTKRLKVTSMAWNQLNLVRSSPSSMYLCNSDSIRFLCLYCVYGQINMYAMSIPIGHKLV